MSQFTRFTAPVLKMQLNLGCNQQRRLLSTNISAALVKELRTKSGAPMMDCKKALMAEGVGGDIDKAIDYLRIKGLAKASANTRTAAEGLIGYYANSDKATMVEINCETDFVNNNKLFQDFVANVATTANTLEAGDVSNDALMQASCALPADGKKMIDALGDIVTSIRENIIVRRAHTVQRGQGQILSTYMHGKVSHDHNTEGIVMGSKLGLVVLGVSGEVDAEQQKQLEEAGRKLAMHVVAAKPLYLDKSSVPADLLAQETAICKDQTEATSAGKKPEIIERMISGKLSKRLAEICLLDQGHMAEDGSPVISKHLAALSLTMKTDVKLSAFYLWHVGQTAEAEASTEETN
jgi:elongation factor Ts